MGCLARPTVCSRGGWHIWCGRVMITAFLIGMAPTMMSGTRLHASHQLTVVWKCRLPMNRERAGSNSPMPPCAPAAGAPAPAAAFFLLGRVARSTRMWWPSSCARFGLFSLIVVVYTRFHCGIWDMSSGWHGLIFAEQGGTVHMDVSKVALRGSPCGCTMIRFQCSMFKHDPCQPPDQLLHTYGHTHSPCCRRFSAHT